MTAVMKGVRILEVAEQTFVPAASAILADWGAEVIKIEHVERGDAMRGLMSSGLGIFNTNVHVLLEHSNRGKQSLGLDLTTPEGIDVLYRLAATCDVFLTNKLPAVRSRLKIELDDLRAHNPAIIYVSGTGQGERGPDADRGSYDSLGFWSRAGVAAGVMRPEDDLVPTPPGPAFGDSIGAMTIAGGIMGALFHRERTGEATTVDVSLLGVGMWAQAAGISLSMQMNLPMMSPSLSTPTRNPLVGTYRTQDKRHVALTCLQAIRYWPDMCRVIGRPELAQDERFADHQSLADHGDEAAAILRESFAAAPLAEWRARLADFVGQWAVVQTTLEVVDDPQVVANGYVQESHTADGTPFRLVAAPVQYGGVPSAPRRAPAFNEHGDAILASIGFDEEQIIELKVCGAVA
jgi:crotonobetainyl-CoA:carnitine CoA-transferase CaiB-like acyl-CoA transferase